MKPPINAFAIVLCTISALIILAFILYVIPVSHEMIRAWLDMRWAVRL